MFVSVKSLTAIIDTRIGYVNEAYENKDNFSDDVFNAYIENMKDTLNASIKTLSQISSNKKLINTYSRKVSKVFSERRAS